MRNFLLATMMVPFLFAPNTAMATKATETRLTRNRIEIAGEILFQSGSDQIAEKSHALLASVAKILKENPDMPVIRITGHTDDVGKAESNQRLSKRRADSVKAYLVSLGVPKDRLEAAGYGEARPRAFGKSPQARKRNRRVDFMLVRPLTVSSMAGFSKSIASGVKGFSGTSGIQAGATAHYAIMDGVTVDLGTHYSQRGAKSDDTTLKMSFIDLPVTGTYTPNIPPIAGIVPNVGGGMVFSLPMGASLDGETLSKGSMQMGAVFAIGGIYEIPLGSMWFQTRYSKALKDAHADVAGLKLGSLDMQAGITF
jgi:hypothetical protein